jgi:hypothetical protein
MRHSPNCRQGRQCPACHRATVAAYLALLAPFPRLQRLIASRIRF